MKTLWPADREFLYKLHKARPGRNNLDSDRRTSNAPEKITSCFKAIYNPKVLELEFPNNRSGLIVSKAIRSDIFPGYNEILFSAQSSHRYVIGNEGMVTGDQIIVRPQYTRDLRYSSRLSRRI